MTELRGMWPGGPSKEDDGDAPRARHRRLRTVEERSSARSDARSRRSRRNRTTRVFVGVAVAVIVAGLGGWALGRRANLTQQEMMAEVMARGQQDAPTGDLQSFMQGQSTRIIQQMWLTEIGENKR